MIIPSIDLMGGKAVQLRQGKEKVLERDDPLGLAAEFAKYGEVAVIDLDAALGRGDNLELVKALCKVADCRVGGGIRTAGRANELLAAGAKKIIIGTAATPEFLSQLPKDRLVVALDSKQGKVVDKGWTNATDNTPVGLAKKLEPLCSEFLYTNVDREGLMQGVDFGAIMQVKASTKNKLTIAGGITTTEEIKKIEEAGMNPQLGMSIYTGAVRLADAFAGVLRFDPATGLIPTIVQDGNGQVLMLAWSSKESVARTFETGKAAYYSRSRKTLWTKGETSGNFQALLTARYDCDRDSLLFTVRQENFACHTGTYSCFGNRKFGLDELYAVVKGKVDDPQEGSFTSAISASESTILDKVAEESAEVIDYQDRENLVWEIADLSYFLLVLMAKKGITPDEVRAELARRRK
ncbi:MAG: bifunctional phosphoribosyl-AMP cyclohydrolase/phosphoribosyl-ATP diphosphatase HisIE [Candidatus Micrarchaeia archaeon]